MKWTVKELEVLYYYAAGHGDKDYWRYIQDNKLTNLINPEYELELDPRAAIRKARDTSYYRENIKPKVASKPEITVVPKNEDECVALFPPRTKEDLKIRRTRMKDALSLHTEPLPILNLLRNFDYIHATNMLYAAHVYGSEWLRGLEELRIYEGLDNFIVGSNALNQVVKKYKCSMQTRIRYAEMANLTGYRIPPISGFNARDEAIKLAQAGEEHGLENWDEIFEAAAEDVMQGQQVEKVDFLTLLEYIDKDIGSTSGASSQGKVHYEYDGKEYKFKARKNFLLDIYTTDEILKMIEKTRGTMLSKAFTKPELGKLRIAVTGDLESYYVQSWLNYLCAHSYTTWSSNTLEEDRIAQMRRMHVTLKLLADNFSLPFDYRGFDHQPRTIENQILVRKYLQGALSNTPPEAFEYVQGYIDDVVNSFDASYCIVDKTGERVKVTGGVQSGIRLTSLLGNFWNQTMTRIVEKLIGLGPIVKATYLRGDDSTILTSNYYAALLFRIGYASINAVGHDAKYGIHYKETEFLRIWYGDNEVWGYPNRCIPGLTQRKPWTSEPWSPDNVTSALYSTLGTLERRMRQSFPAIKTMITQAWQRIRKLDWRYLTVPVGLGGLGILPWTGYVPSVRYPQFLPGKNVVFKTKATTEQRYKTIYEGSLTKTDLSRYNWLEFQQRLMNRKSATDDVPQVNSALREGFRVVLDKMRKEANTWQMRIWKGRELLLADSGIELLSTIDSPDRLKEYERSLDRGRRYYRRYDTMRQKWNDIRELGLEKPLQEFDKYAPGFLDDVRILGRKGLHRTAAIDLLFGEVKRSQDYQLHDAMAATVTAAVVKAMENLIFSTHERNALDFAPDYYALMASQALQKSPLYQQLLRY